jgi:hypothetical protein
MMRHVRVWRFLLTLAMSGSILLSASAVSAQGVGSIFGKVTDASGAVLPGVTVTVSGPRLQQPLVAQTSSSGTYQFPTVPIGTYSVTFELQGFKKAVRQNIIIDTGFNAQIDNRLEVGALTEEVTVTGESPVVDLKKTTVGAVFDKDVLEKIPSARDPWQIINMAPGVVAGLNVGGSSSGQQVGLDSRGTNDNVQWNLDGANITDLSSNSSVMYYNFDSFDQIQVNNGGGDVTVQSSGLNINLVTKSGSNVFKGTFNTTFENDDMQTSNVTQQLFDVGDSGFLSGAPIHKIAVYSIEAGGPIIKNRLWYWGAADRQDINVGVVNFFDPGKGSLCGDLIAAQRTGSSALANAITYGNLGQVQKCLQNDKTLIKNLQWKFNYQLSNAHRIQYGFVSDEKYRNHRGASANTAPEVTTQQVSDAPWNLPIPSHTIQHSWVASDKLVFNSSFNYTGGGFFLDYQDWQTAGGSRYIGATDPLAYMTGARGDANALWNQQHLRNRTTSFQSRSLLNSYQTVRKTWELKTDSTYFLTHKLGGDHSLKFGAGWRRAPILTYQHYSGGARADVQCVGNNEDNCGSGVGVAPGSGPGLVPYRAILARDLLVNNDWWTYFGYIQNEYSRGRWRIKGGLRYDWQHSKSLGGCVPANILVPDLLPAQCEEETQTDVVNGRDIKPFSNWSPRVAATYDLFGNGKTAVHASGSYYYDTKITLANSLSGLNTALNLTWGPNPSSGNCSTTEGASCWNDANHDLIVQRSELIGVPTPNSSRFDINTGVLRPAGNTVDPDTKIRRTREGIVGMSHELLPDLAVGVDYIYRKYDRGTEAYTIGYQPGAPGFPISQLYSDRHEYTDPVSGYTGYYYTVCQGCSRPSGVGTITMTSLQYDVYHGVDLTATKRFSNRWQMQIGATLQRTTPYYPTGAFDADGGNPTNREFRHGFHDDRDWIFKANGAYTFPFEITVAANLIANHGSARVTTIDGPGSVYGGVSATTGRATTISYGSGSLEVEPRGTTRLDNENLLDMSVQKTFMFRGGKQRVKFMFDVFNVFNAHTIIDWSSDNRSNADFSSVSDIVPPRVMRIGLQIGF